MTFVDLLMVLDYRQSVIDSLRDWADHSMTDAEAWHLRQVRAWGGRQMKREVIYRTDAMAAVGNLKGLLDTEKSKAVQAVLGVPAVQTCEDAVSRQQAIDALMVRDKELRNINWYDKPYAEGECRGIDEALTIVSNLPSVQPDFDITVKIDKAYDDGYKAGYLQGRHDWGDLDE